jgi:hypothetical protein
VRPASGGALVETVIYTFPLSDGAAFGSCYSTTGMSGSGDLYGTAVSDGAYGMGSVSASARPRRPVDLYDAMVIWAAFTNSVIPLSIMPLKSIGTRTTLTARV